MKRKLIIGLICCFLSLEANALSAKEALEITKNSEKRIENKIQNNPKLKNVFEQTVQQIYANIKKIANKGFVYSTWLDNSTPVIKNINKLKQNKKISNEDFRIIKKLIENKLIKDGYKIQYGRYDSEYNFHFRIDW